MTTINFHQTTSEHFRKNFVLNYVELSAIGKTMLDGSDSIRFNEQFIDVYKGSTRVYQFGYTYFTEDEHWYGKEGYELEG